MALLCKEDFEKIKAAVGEAEKKTSGEIATAFIRESSNYAYYELLTSIIAGFVYFVVMMFFTGPAHDLLQSMFWDFSPEHMLMFYGLSTFLVIFLTYWLTNIPLIDRLIVPAPVMRRMVSERARRYFIESETCNTRDRSGILIFISCLEHRVELIADKGINARIPQEKWNDIVAHIITGIKRKKLALHLIEAIHECGKLLETHFPIHPDDVNELSNDLAILED